MNPTIVDNVIFWLKAHELQGSICITSNADDRCYAWPRGNQLLNYMVENGWNPDPNWAGELMHGTQYSFREPGGVHPAMQVCVHPAIGKNPPYFFEIDFDLSSPAGGIGDFFVHAGEVIIGLFGSKTNQEKVAELLHERLKEVVNA